jgi:hypothetical protein
MVPQPHMKFQSRVLISSPPFQQKNCDHLLLRFIPSYLLNLSHHPSTDPHLALFVPDDGVLGRIPYQVTTCPTCERSVKLNRTCKERGELNEGTLRNLCKMNY